MFLISHEPLVPDALRARLAHPAAGALATFEGWVRNHNEGCPVDRLDYSAYEALAMRVGSDLVAETMVLFDLTGAVAVHRVGSLGVGELAVWVGAAAIHRADALAACGYLIDEIKRRLPVWKREHYSDGRREWVACACEGHAAFPQWSTTEAPFEVADAAQLIPKTAKMRPAPHSLPPPVTPSQDKTVVRTAFRCVSVGVGIDATPVASSPSLGGSHVASVR